MIDNRIKNTIKYPTALVVNGVNGVGMELISALLEQGAYVICVDLITEKNFESLNERFGEGQLVTFLDYSKVAGLASDLRRLDYTFYLTHQQYEHGRNISAQEMLRQVNYLDAVLVASSQFQAKFLLSSSIEAGYEQVGAEAASLALSATAGRTAAQLLQYFESLVIEYTKEASLDARVLRLGELMGDGMDLGKVNGFQKLLLQAVAGKGLTLDGDGLEAGYYVHVLDAAYGLIKTMFSEETLGRVYQVCYDAPITQLTLAYRLQEVEKGVGAINFQHRSQESDYSIKLKNLAPSLSQLGWRPRVDLEQAISESVVYAKTSVLSGEFEQPGAWDQVVDRLRSFVAQPRDSGRARSQTEAAQASAAGPVSRLIAERQQAVTAQSKGINAAAAARKLHARPAVETWQGFMWRQLKSWQTQIAAFGQVTPTQFVMIIVGIVLFIGFYFYIFSPVAVIGKNLFLGYENSQRLNKAIAESDLKTIVNELNSAATIWEETEAALSTISVPLSWLGLGVQVDQVQEIVSVYQELAVAGQKVAYGLEPLATYTNDYVSNVRYRPNSESYLAAGGTTKYESLLEQFNARQIFLETGASQMSQAIEGLSALRISLPSAEAVNFIKQVNTDVLNTAAQTQALAENAIQVDKAINKHSKNHILVLVVDETVPQPIGGQLTGWVALDVEEGGVVQATARTVSNTQTSVSMPSYITAKYSYLASDSKEKLNWSDLAYLSADADIYFAANKLWQAELDKSAEDLGQVYVVSISALRDIWSSLGGIELEGQSLNADNFVGQLALTENLPRRQELIIKAVAVSLDKYLQELNTNLPKILQLLSKLDELDKAKVVTATFSEEDLTNSVDWARISLLADNRLGSNGKLPFISQSSNIAIEADGLLRHEMVINTATVDNIAGVQVCLPLEAKNIQVQRVDLADVSSNNFIDERCVLVRSENFEFEVSWEIAAFAKTNEGSYNLDVGVIKPISARLESNIEVEIASGLTVQSVTPRTIVVEGAFAFTDLLDNNAYIKITLED